MKKTGQLMFRSLFAAIVAGLLCGSLGMAKERPERSIKGASGADLAKTTGPTAYQPERYQILNINNLWSWHREDGQSNHSPTGDNGTFFPRGTSFVIYQDGMVWGSKAYVDPARTQPAPLSQTIRVGGTTYGTGARAGWVEGFGANATPVDQDNPRARMYRIRRDFKDFPYNDDGTFTDEIKRDAAESSEIPVGQVTNEQAQAVIDEYKWSWENWPTDLGAPFIDRNGNGVYDPPPANFTTADLIEQGYDEPGLAGADPNSPADQVLWTVFNDLNRATSVGQFGSEPTGLEVRMTMWGYKRTDALGNIFFRKWEFENVGGVDIDANGTKGAFYLDSMYVCQWSDPDLGSFSDDLIGCDTTLSIGYVYNGNAVDTEFRKFELPPPSAGYDFLQGPAIPSPGDTAIFNLKPLPDHRNLGLTAFAYFSAGSAFSDPPGANYSQGTIRWYKMLRGFVPLDGEDQPYPVPPGFEPGPFPYSGDPVAGTGHIDGQGQSYSFVPGDRRLLCITGPFTLDPGETQEVVVALVCGLGADRLSSISVMKFNDRFAQNTYDALFQVPNAPAPPAVRVSEFSGRVILEWGSNLARLTQTEQTVNDPGSFRFEGYNVYQLPSPNSTLADARRIATFDAINEITVVLDEQFDLNSGLILEKPVQFGTNSGVSRQFIFDRDYVNDRDAIYNGSEYYLAVTAYSVAEQEGYLPTTLESQVQVITVVPKIPFGQEFQTAYGDTIPVTHPSGKSDGVITPIVVDPARSNGDTYEITFSTTDDGATVWNVKNQRTGEFILQNQTNQAGDDNYNIIQGGVFLKVAGPPPGLKSWDWPAGSRFLTWAGGADGLQFEGFNGAIGYASPRSVFGDGVLFIEPDETKNIEIRFANVDPQGNFDPNHPNVSYAYRFGRGFAGAPARPEFAPFIVNPAGGYSYQDFGKSVPLAVYDIEDPANPRRLAVGHLENNVEGGAVDGKYWPPNFGVGDNTAGGGPREWLWIFDADYSETPNPEWQVEAIAGPQPIMYYATWARRNDNPWTDQDRFVHISNKPNTTEDVFTYRLPEPETGPALNQAGVERIGVFPNPYYAFNPQETNRLSRFVTVNNLPQKATIRVFNLAGQLVRRIDKDSQSQFQRWDLLNHSGLPVASGMYLLHIDLPDLGSTKVLKVAIVQEAEVLDVF